MDKQPMSQPEIASYEREELAVETALTADQSIPP